MGLKIIILNWNTIKFKYCVPNLQIHSQNYKGNARSIACCWQHIKEAYLGPYQASINETFCKISLKKKTQSRSLFLKKHSLIDVWHDSYYGSDIKIFLPYKKNPARKLIFLKRLNTSSKPTKNDAGAQLA